MSLDDSVDLVTYAFENAIPGDVFVQQSPACTVATLAEAMKQLMNADNEIRTIGTRHGEKLYESLVSREEMTRAIDKSGYFRIVSDTRDLNYQKYVSEGETDIAKAKDYTSHNTRQLDVEGVKEVLMRLPIMQEAVHG